MSGHLDSSTDPVTLQGRIESLAQALGNVLVDAGMVRADAAMTGPELLMAALTYCEGAQFERQRFTAAVVALNHPGCVEVAEPVARDDGRFYVPVNRKKPVDGLSATVLRIASDAFFDLDSAQVFANVIAGAYNGLPGASSTGD